MARDSLERQGLTSQLLSVLERDLMPAATPFAQPLSDQAYRRLPLMAWGDLLRPVARYLTDYLRHPEDGPYWWAMNHVFLPGHSLRLDIASSNSPRFDRNLNTAEDQATGTRWHTAAQTIWHDQRYPSHVLLPVIPR